MKKIFVGNLAWRASEEDLKKLFEVHGTVLSVKIVTDQYTGKSKGFGFVEMETAEGAAAAIADLNDKPYLERNLRVSAAQDRPSEGRSQGGGGGYGGGGGGGYGGGGGDRGGERRSSGSWGNGGGGRGRDSR
jgi:RNA recognition motif-containing protein